MKTATFRNSQGFTLIELIIVVIIIGILAAIALPKLTASFDVGKLAEVNQFTGSLKSAVDTCYMTNSNSLSACNTYTALNITPPSSSFFDYTSVAPATAAGGTFTLKVGLKPSTGTNFVTVVYTPTAVNTSGANVITYTGAGSLASYKKQVQAQ